MIFYNDELVSAKGTPEVYRKIQDQLNQIKKDYFDEGTRGYVKLLYPKGEPRRNSSKFWEPRKPFQVPLISGDGMYRYSKYKPHIDPATKAPSFQESHRLIRSGMKFTVEDIDFVWLLLNHCQEIKKGILKIEDPEAIAKKKNEGNSVDIDLRYFLFGNSSPLSGSNGIEPLKSLADAAGIKEASVMRNEELRNAVYDAFRNGERDKDPIINFKNFLELTNGENKRRALIIARKAIATGKLVFDKNLYSWRLSGRDDVFLRLTGAQMGSAEALVLEAVVNDVLRRVWLFHYMGEKDIASVSELSTIKRQDLVSLANRFEVEFVLKDSNPDIVRKISEKIGASENTGI